MKKSFLLIIVIICVNFTFSQNNNLYVYETYEDYVNNKHTDYGIATGHSMTLGARKIHVLKDNKASTVKINKKWGFKIGNYLYRFNKKENIAVSVCKNDFGLVFYIEGDFTLRLAIWGRDLFKSTDHVNDGYFYSNDLNSEIYGITKINKIKNPTSELKSFIECIEEGKKRHGYQAQFNSYGKCIFPNED